NVALKQKIGLDQLSSVQKELNQLTSDLRKARLDADNQANTEKTAMERPVPEREIKAMIAVDATVKRLEFKVTSAQSGVTSATQAFGANDSTTKKMQEKLEAAQRELETYKEKLRPKLEASYRENMKAQAQARQLAAQERVGLYENMEK